MSAALAALTPWTDRAGGFSPLRLVVFLALLLPGADLAWQAWSQALGPEPLRAAMKATGTLAIQVLLLSLFVTPLRQLLRWARLAELRRMVGLFALAYAVVHLALYAGHQGWSLPRVLSEIVQRFYLTVGFVALLGLVVLGVTSTDGWLHRLGGRAWRRLHRIVFAVGLLALLHFMLHAKSDITQPVMMAGLFLWLAAYRVLAPPGGAPGAWTLLGLACGPALVTGLGEAAWYALKTGVDARLVLAANLDLLETDWAFVLEDLREITGRIRPALWVLLAGLLALLARGAARRLPRGRPARSRVEA